jgi:TolB-like protein
MRLLTEIKERRLIPLMAAYLVTGFVALEAMDQLISYGFLPERAYPVTLVLYLFGIPSSLIFAWFHGAPGRQYAVRGEIISQGGLFIVAVSTAIFVYRTQVPSLDYQNQMGLPPTSIAVLPFQDVSARGEIEYVADGITDALIDQLDDVPSLQVISKTGVLPFRDTRLRPDSIARILSVGTLVTGNVDQVGDQLLITTRLIEGVGGADIERSLIELPAGDFLAARDSVAGNVSRLLRERLGQDVTLRELRAGTNSQEAWILAQRAERLRTDAEDNFEAQGDVTVSIQAFEEADSLLALAEEADPTWVRLPGARAHAAYRRAWFAAGLGDLDTVTEQIEVGRQHVARALQLDPDNAFALEQRGTLEILAAQTMASSEDEVTALLEEARVDLEAAVAEDPSLASAHAMLSFLYGGLLDNINAVLSGQTALQEDAYLRGADRIIDRLIYAQYDLGQFRQAGEWCDRGRQRFPDNYRFVECQLWLMATPQGSTDVGAAWDLLEQLDSMSPEALRDYKHQVGLIMVAGVLRRAELADSAASVLSRVDHSEAVDPQRVLYGYEAGIRASTGDPEGAMDVLRRWATAAPGATSGIDEDTHWWWRSLQGRPDFEALANLN